MGYLIFQTLVFLLVAFAIGCVIGCWLKRFFGSSGADTASPQSAAPPPAPVTAADMSTSDSRPEMLAAPRGGAKDNLKRIKGIGPVNEGRLNKLGIFHFDQIAGWGPNEVNWVDDYLNFKGRVEREDWIGQAKMLAGGGETEFSSRVDKDQVSTSAGKKS